MPIRVLEHPAAIARLNALRFDEPVEVVARRLAEWQLETGGLVVPISVKIAPAQVAASDEDDDDDRADATRHAFAERAATVRSTIAHALGIDPKHAWRLTFRMSGNDAWYLGPRPKLDRASMLVSVAREPEIFIELMLLRELIESAAFDPDQAFVVGGFGPSVYLGMCSRAHKRVLHLAEALFEIRSTHQLVVCDVRNKAFVRKAQVNGALKASSTLLADAGEGFMVGVTRLVPSCYKALDAREWPLVGVSLDTMKMRNSRLYYLNLVTEFAFQMFRKAGVPISRETFVATHCVDDGYIPLQGIANLRGPLVVVNASDEEMTAEALKPLSRMRDFMPDGYHASGPDKVHFEVASVSAGVEVPSQPDPQLNYLVLNGRREDGTVRIQAHGEAAKWRWVKPKTAYAALARGRASADPYTTSKFLHVMDRDTVDVTLQGLDQAPSTLASLRPGKLNPDDRPVQEAIKRCLVELSLKECLVGRKAIPTPSMPPGLPSLTLTLIATRRIQVRTNERKQLVAAVDVRLADQKVTVERVRRSPWSADESAAIDFVAEFPFLNPNPKEPIGDGQFWIVDPASGDRLRAWAGGFVPKIILNDAYPSIEAALAAQDGFLAEQRVANPKSGGRLYSKSRTFNLLPYYISMYRETGAARGERNWTRHAAQDRCPFVRVFVPPADGLNGKGDALAGMRDVVVHRADGETIQSGLLECPLVQIYLHTMTNGLLVGGDNSKMSVFEKLPRLALEN